MSRLDRYVAREIAVPAFVAFCAYTGFMLVRGLFQFADLVLQSQNPGREILAVLGLSLPHIVVLTIPVSLLLGLLVGVGRLSADSELIALRASGVDLIRLYVPIGLVATAAGTATLGVMLGLVPASNQLLLDKKLQLSTYLITQRVQPGVFSPNLWGRRIYVESASADRRSLRNVIVSDRSDPTAGERLTLAREGRLEVDAAEGQLWLALEDAVTHVSGPEPGRYDRTSNRMQRVLLEDTNPRERRARLEVEKQLREQTLPELLVRAREARAPMELRLTWVEIHKKFALPAACLVFGLIGLPLGVVNRRGGRAAGFAISIAIVVAYYILLATGEAKAIDGATSPFLAMWLPNLLLVLLGLVALARVRKDRPLLPALSWRLGRSDAGSDGDGAPRKAVPAGSRGEAPRERRLVSPALFLIDRYVAGRFLRLFALVAASIVALYVVIDVLEISDNIAKTKPPASLVVRYLQAKLAPIVLDVVPFAFLVAALITTAAFVRSSETTALLAHGVSLHRFALPIVLLAAASGAGLWLFSERVVPRAAVEADELRDAILGKPPGSRTGLSQVWFRGEEGRFLALEDVDVDRSSVSGLSVLEIDRSTFRLQRRIDAPAAAVVAGKGFRIGDGWLRTFTPGGEMLVIHRTDGFLLEVPEATRVLSTARTDPRQMTSPELARFIAARRRSGADVSALETGLYQKSSAAAAAVLLTLLGLPFSFRFGKRGAAAGIGVALFVGLAYLVVSTVLVRFGESAALAPLLASWGANVLFALAALYGLLGIRT